MEQPDGTEGWSGNPPAPTPTFSTALGCQESPLSRQGGVKALGQQATECLAPQRGEMAAEWARCSVKALRPAVEWGGPA